MMYQFPQIAPESEKADIWAVGALAYRLLTGVSWKPDEKTMSSQESLLILQFCPGKFVELGSDS